MGDEQLDEVRECSSTTLNDIGVEFLEQLFTGQFETGVGRHFGHLLLYLDINK